MKNTSAKKNNSDLRPEYDLSKLKGGIRGKYYRRAIAGTNLVLIEPELTNVFPDAESVNRALRLLADTAASATEKGPSRSKIRNRRIVGGYTKTNSQTKCRGGGNKEAGRYGFANEGDSQSQAGCEDLGSGQRC